MQFEYISGIIDFIQSDEDTKPDEKSISVSSRKNEISRLDPTDTSDENKENGPLVCITEIPIMKVVTKGKNVFILQENNIFSMMGTNLEEIRMKDNRVVVHNNPSRNKTIVIRNKVKDFDCMDDMLIICTATGGVLATRVNFNSTMPNLSFHSLSSMGSTLENYNFVSSIS